MTDIKPIRILFADNFGNPLLETYKNYITSFDMFIDQYKDCEVLRENLYLISDMYCEFRAELEHCNQLQINEGFSSSWFKQKDVADRKYGRLLKFMENMGLENEIPF